MDAPVYQDDQNRQLVSLQPVPQSSGGFMDYVRNNKLTVAIAILVLIGLIWWFCMRKKDTVVTNVGTAPAAVPIGNSGSLNITKTRLNNTRIPY